MMLKHINGKYIKLKMELKCLHILSSLLKIGYFYMVELTDKTLTGKNHINIYLLLEIFHLIT